jgi:hypothetical protein
MNMLELQPDPDTKANKITYTYDQYDRVYLKNYYQGTVPRARYYRAISNTNFKTPKKLLYQDVYRYKSNTANQPYFVDRIYQPIISTPILTRDESDNITATATVVCKSPTIQSGFILDTVQDALVVKTLYPNRLFWNNGGGDYNVQGSNGIGKLTWTFTNGSPVYVKAYCTMETGVLFSKAATI